VRQQRLERLERLETRKAISGQNYSHRCQALLCRSAQAATRGGHAPDADFATRFPRAAKYTGWPMLVVMALASCS
jgi:hypothetical protein